MNLCRIEAGRFRMGTDDGERERLAGLVDADWWREAVEGEGPRHTVEITRAFEIGIYPVTVGEFARFARETGYLTEAERDATGSYRWDESTGRWRLSAWCTWRAPGFDQDESHPVVCASWNDAVAYCSWAGERAGRPVRLPTEAEWEYACRAGTASAYAFGDELRSEAANFDPTGRRAASALGAYVGRTSPVGSYAPNAFGVFDMHGNVYEWCADWLDLDYYGRSPRRDPAGPDVGTERVVRGGAWNTVAERCRSACRKGGWPDFRINRRGFRVAVDAEAAPPKRGKP